jgi:hypothetical protein
MDTYEGKSFFAFAEFVQARTPCHVSGCRNSTTFRKRRVRENVGSSPAFRDQAIGTKGVLCLCV